MFQLEIDKSKNLMKSVFSQRVTADETRQWREKLDGMLSELKPDFRLLSDLSGLESMELACAPDIEWSMERFSKAGVSKVVRIIPDPRQDIGLSIMSLFHYRRSVSIVTCQTMEEALKALEN
jgi:hypothetical protein